MGDVVTKVKEASAYSGTSVAFILRTTERWRDLQHTEYHNIVVTNEAIADYVMRHCPINTKLHIEGNIRHNSVNKRTEILVRELRRI